MGRANGVGGLDEVVDVDLMLALSAGKKKLKLYNTTRSLGPGFGPLVCQPMDSALVSG